MTTGSLVRLSGGSRPMVVVRVQGPWVHCSWRWSDGSVRSDWFAASSLRALFLPIQ